MLDVRDLVKSKAPSAVAFARRLRGRSLARKTPAEVFREIFESNQWGDPESVSGSGSSLRETAALRAALPGLLSRLRVSSLLDAPCGDFHWMKTVELPGVSYIGGDIVEPIVEANQQQHGSEQRRFQVLDVATDPIPAADMILCRDCLVHFSFDHIATTLENFARSGAKYLATTTFTQRTVNTDIVTGQWRPLNLQLPPFNLPPPIELVNEDSAVFDKAFSDKALAVWEIGSLRVRP